VRPFLLLSIRGEPAPAASEYAAFVRYLGVSVDDVVRHRLGVDPLPGSAGALEQWLTHWSAVILGGGAYTFSDDAATKSAEQVAAEADLRRLLEVIVPADRPFLGICYGIGTLGSFLGGVVDRTHPEAVGPVEVELTPEGRADPLFAGLPEHFDAYGGHKEGLTVTAGDVVVLATSAATPVQAFRVGEHVYATQFHPELDLDGLLTRIEAYAGHGYFDPADAEELARAGRAVAVSHPMRILGNFAARYGHEPTPGAAPDHPGGAELTKS